MNQNAFFELVTKVLSGEATPDEIKLFDSYMLDDECRDLYEWLKKEWDKDVEHPVEKFEYARGLEKLQTKIKSAEQTQRAATVLRMPMQKRFLYAAASVALLLTFAFLAKTLLLSDNIKKQVHFQSYQTQRGERKVIELPDGSKIHMNSETSIRYPSDFSGSERKVSLTGEAFFLVREDRQRPFTVQSGDVTTTVLGTSFNVSAFPENNAYITVVSGKVKVTNQLADAKIILTKGEQAVYNKQVGDLSKTVVDVGPYTDWRNGILHFDGITFGEAIGQMERWYNVTIQCNSSTLIDRNIRGIYEKESLENVLEDMQFMLELKYEFVNDSLIMIRQ